MSSVSWDTPGAPRQRLAILVKDLLFASEVGRFPFGGILGEKEKEADSTEGIAKDKTYKQRSLGL